MTIDSFDCRIQEINKIVEELPPDSRERIRELVQETQERQHGIRKSGQAALAAIEEIRNRCRHLVSNAEALHRESQIDSDQRTGGPRPS